MGNTSTIEDLRCDNEYFKNMSYLVEQFGLLGIDIRRHCFAVKYVAMNIAKLLGRLSDQELFFLKWGCLMHDIGKLRVQKSILCKAGTLTEQEYDQIKKHPIEGCKLLHASEVPSQIFDIIMFHHERYDGKGYPNKLSGKMIPIGARITSVADAYDAMVSERPYRRPLSKAAAINEIYINRGHQFDPEIVDAFLEIVRAKKVDCLQYSGGELL